MTHRHDVDLDLLADYLGGALDGTPDEATVERLIADDPAWAQAYAETSAATEAVRVDLSSLGADQDRMPADVVDRLAAALPPVHLDEGARVVPLVTRRQRWVRRLTPVAVAAGVLACVGVGATLLQQDADRQESTGSAGLTRDAEGPAVTRPAPPSATGPAPAPAQAGQGSAREGARSPGTLSEGDTAAPPPPTATGTDYTRDTLSQLTAGKRTSEGTQGVVPPAAPGTGAAAVPPQLRRLTDPAALSACLAAITSADATSAGSVRLVDLARFEGSPAVVVLLADAAWVSGPDCGLAGPDTRYRTPGG